MMYLCNAEQSLKYSRMKWEKSKYRSFYIAHTNRKRAMKIRVQCEMLRAISIYCHFSNIFMKKSLATELICKRLFHTPQNFHSFVAWLFIKFLLMDQVDDFCVHFSSSALKLGAYIRWIYIFILIHIFNFSSVDFWISGFLLWTFP